MIERTKEENDFTVYDLIPYSIALVDFESGKIKKYNNTFKELASIKKLISKNINFFEFFSIDKKQIKENKKIISKVQTTTNIKYYKINFTFFNKNEILVYIDDVTIEQEKNIIYEDNEKLLEYIAIEKSFNKTLNKIVNFAQKRMENVKCSILLLDEEGEHLLNGAAPSLPKFYNDAIHGVKIGDKIGSCGSAAFNKKRVIVKDINTHENWAAYKELAKNANLASCWSEPIFSSNKKVLGTFAIYNEVPKAPNKFEIQLINSYANITSIAIEKYQNINELKQSKDELQNIFENSSVALLYMSKDRVFIRSNLTAAKIFGFKTQEEMIGLEAKKLHISEKNYHQFRKNYLDVIKQGKTFTCDYPLKRIDGLHIWCELSCKALDNNKSPDLSKGILWSVKDISLRKQYEKKLKNSEILNKQIISAIPQLIWLKNEKGVYLRCNKEFEKLFGAKEEEIVGKSDYDFVDKKLADFFKQKDKEAIYSSKININEELLEYKETKEKHLIETSKQAIKDEDGNIIGILGIGFDITQRKKREEELKKLNALAQDLSSNQKTLLSLFDKGDSVLFNWKNDLSWSVDYVSKSVEKLLSYSTKNFISKDINYIDCIYEDDKKRVLKEIDNAIKNNLDYFRHEPYRIITKNNEIKWVLNYTVTKKNPNNKITNFIGYLTDITNQIKNQEIMYQQSKIASMGEMLGNISHQWRQPLSAISTLATGAKLKKEINVLNDEDFIKTMDSINNQAQYLSSTIDDFRNFFAEDTKNKTNINLKNSLETTLSLVKDSYKSNNITTIKNMKDAHLLCNENMFIQAILNILNNAKDAYKNNRKKEKLVFIDLIKEEETYILTIKDNANGIEEKIMDKIFEPYFTTKHQSQGTGIGLYMTNQIITKHFKGKIIVSNEEFIYNNKSYKGACFKIILPI
ncbi:PAS domain S-box protein [Arcobacter arenosus]|nr:PAS domain S-box protein [Arcobacter arenosus]